ncbi:uncharacterized protein LOC128554153 [Mercenaria mercenaria]|uniref:uncharacterized protein LOC128554153 n=1 Tax=Mercenaria mercenaria TaxID=6596 RepID=UPI00234F9A04|nr:uncharacterized protein LOC128554153 [Mercenaria mercenaria]
MCRETFMFCHGISKNKLANIASSLDKNGLKPRTHGNTGKMPKHDLSMTDIEQIVSFLSSYANANGLPLPGRLPNYRQESVILLPSDQSKADIHALYNEAAQQNSFRVVSLSEFKKIWLQQCPHIVICKPATDLCAKCQKYAHEISNSGNLSEEDKEKLLENYRTYLSKAKCQRDYYREKCEAAKLNYSVMTPEQKLRGQPPCSLPRTQQYSFDFAQQLFYPHHAQQVGPLYFKTPRKCQCFGVCSEGAGTQVFYLIDEADCTGKGANCVTSLLHHHFQHHGFGEEHVQLQMDNCSGQNKNNTVLWYGLWRTMTGLHKTVEFSLMEAGHTKFSPDWHFGVFKSKWRHCTVETLDHIATCVLLSS